ncbi:hypothetical protein HHL21_08675 [Massilia sp. RP-1-19]|uniref:Zinc ribbon domain-containing protein n=1 Tax=Massilia polaris TaxID=2728846 RepID=A0A848HJ94_9BURK|nr:hypothetical protein [Massilia polaris]NML61152.1 hypothetical protein [Massilia polaris]
MSYEFNPENPVFEFPNPYKVENVFRIGAGALMVLASCIVMLDVRARLAQGLGGKELVVAAIAVGLLVFGIVQLAQAFTQLRFFFGRDRPQDLALRVAPDSDGNSRKADELKELLRQNAMSFEEPKGPLNGLLYSMLPHLIFAPIVLQHTAQAQFYRFLSLAVTLASLLACWFFFGQGAASGWIGIGYALFAAPQVLKPLARHNSAAAGPMDTSTAIGLRSLVVLIVLALLGPALLGLGASLLPNLHDFSINGALALGLLCALLGCAAFGIALNNQLEPAPQAIGSARVSETLTINAHPNKLIEEIDRVLMERWYNRIPNRRYTRRSPAVNGEQGQFTADLFEETQPRPQPNRTAEGIAHAMATPQFRWLVLLTGFAALCMVAGAVATLLFSKGLLAGKASTTFAAIALFQMAVGAFCFRAAHVLWGRFDFVSELMWVDLSGSYESARVNVGNQLSGQVQTQKSVINVESMTMRVWVSEIDTVIFGKDARRQLIRMRGMQGVANELAAHLKAFGETRSMVVAPTSAADLERARQVGATGHAVAAGASGAALAMDVAASDLALATEPVAVAEAPARPRFCTGCGVTLVAQMRFCGDCGTAAGV